MMVANIRCGEIVRERLEAMRQSEVWQQICQQSGAELLSTFGAIASDIIRASISGEYLPLPLLAAQPAGI